MVVTRRQASAAAQNAERAENGAAGSSEKTANGGAANSRTQTTPLWVYLLLTLIAIVTVVMFPRPFQPHGQPTLKHVFFYGWLTAISTGLGVVPFFCLPAVASYWVGVSNGESRHFYDGVLQHESHTEFPPTAIAAGMMIAASYSLFVEGCTYSDPDDKSFLATELRTAIGAILGLAFILATKKFLDQYEDLKVGGLGGTDARKALLIFFVMTLHSFSEGVGIGVSFGGVHGSELGLFISASLAVVSSLCG